MSLWESVIQNKRQGNTQAQYNRGTSTIKQKGGGIYIYPWYERFILFSTLCLPQTCIEHTIAVIVISVNRTKIFLGMKIEATIHYETKHTKPHKFYCQSALDLDPNGQANTLHGHSAAISVCLRARMGE